MCVWAPLVGIVTPVFSTVVMMAGPTDQVWLASWKGPSILLSPPHSATMKLVGTLSPWLPE